MATQINFPTGSRQPERLLASFRFPSESPFRDPMAVDGFIYAVQCERTGVVKVGFSFDPGRRVRKLAGAYPFRLTPLGWVRAYLSEEKEVHRALSAHRIKGEWFAQECLPELVAWIDRLEAERNRGAR